MASRPLTRSMRVVEAMVHTGVVEAPFGVDQETFKFKRPTMLCAGLDPGGVGQAAQCLRESDLILSVGDSACEPLAVLSIAEECCRSVVDRSIHSSFGRHTSTPRLGCDERQRITGFRVGHALCCGHGAMK